ncbi:MAG: hypothetical protein LUD72_14700 [Bacteroidales bacterium]|nr:hypothetical protein [Bacteroidales bacterium]
MPATAIETVYGCSLHRVLTVYGVEPEIDTENDLVLFVIRDKKGNPVYYDWIAPEYCEDLGCAVFVICMTPHDARHVPAGKYTWGADLYRGITRTYTPKKKKMHADACINLGTGLAFTVIEDTAARGEGVH